MSSSDFLLRQLESSLIKSAPLRFRLSEAQRRCDLMIHFSSSLLSALNATLWNVNCLKKEGFLGTHSTTPRNCGGAKYLDGANHHEVDLIDSRADLRTHLTPHSSDSPPLIN